MNKNKILVVSLILILFLVSFLSPVRHYFKSFFMTLFEKEIIDYDSVPISNDTIYRLIHIGSFESDQFMIERTDSLQICQDKTTGEIWKNKLKWIHENEYFLYDSNGKIMLKNKIINLTDTSYIKIYSSSTVAKKIEFDIKTAHNRQYK